MYKRHARGPVFTEAEVKERVKKATNGANTFANRLTNALFTEEEVKEKVDKANTDANALTNRLTSAIVAAPYTHLKLPTKTIV